MDSPATQKQEVPLPTAIRQSLIYPAFQDARSQIRVLHVTPAPFEEGIQCRLEVVSLEDSPYYAALSYVWGDTSDLRAIQVNDVPFNVTASQEEALRHQRAKGAEVVWIDGICIDQANLEERASQVTIMGQVYRQASRVHVWFGQPAMNPSLPAWVGGRPFEHWLKTMTQDVEQELGNDGIRDLGQGPLTYNSRHAADEFLNLMRLLDVQRESMLPCITDLPFYEIISVDDSPRVRLRPIWYQSIEFLKWMIERPWWSRVWVLQELGLSKCEQIILMGSLSTTFRPLVMMLRRLAQNPWQGSGHVDCSCHRLAAIAFPFFANGLYQDAFSKTNVTILQTRARYSLSTDGAYRLARVRDATLPHDYVYGMLGMLHPDDGKLIRPDYSISQDRVYAQATKMMISTSGFSSLRFLQHAVGVQSPTAYQLGSWIVDWSRPSEYENCPFPPVAPGLADQLFPDQAVEDFERFFDASDEVLPVWGILINTIQETASRYNKSSRSADIEEALRGCVDLTSRVIDATTTAAPSDGLPKDKTIPHSVWRAITDNKKGVMEGLTWPGDLRHQDLDLDDADLTELHRMWLSASGDNDDASFEDRRFLHRLLSDKIVFNTTNGHLGSSRPSVRPGDKVFLLLRCYAPVILRAVDPDSNRYRFVGLAYLDGWMDGEEAAMVGPEAIRLELV